MTPKLTDDLRQAIEEHGGNPLYLVDATNNRYVLLRADEYEKIQALLEDQDPDPRDLYPLIDEAMQRRLGRSGDGRYNYYDAHRPEA